MIDKNFKRKIVVITAGLSNPSSSRILADKILLEVIKNFEQADLTVDGSIFELRDYAQDITNNMLTGYPNEDLESMIEEVLNADGLILVTPIFSSSYSGLFKSFLDILDPKALIGKPVLIGATAGTQRHSLAIEYSIKPVLNYFHADVVSSGVFAATNDWGDPDTAKELNNRIKKSTEEFFEILKNNNKVKAYDPYYIEISFE